MYKYTYMYQALSYTDVDINTYTNRYFNSNIMTIHVKVHVSRLKLHVNQITLKSYTMSQGCHELWQCCLSIPVFDA